MGALEIFGTPWLRPRLLFPKFYGLLLRWYHPEERWWVPISPPIHTYYSSISTRLPEIFDCSYQWGLWIPNVGEGDDVGDRGWYRSKERWWVHISPPYILFLYQHSFSRKFRLQPLGNIMYHKVTKHENLYATSGLWKRNCNITDI